MLKTINYTILKQLKALIKLTSSSAVNFSCAIILGQSKLPEQIKKLRKF
ncbi:cyclic lactone autoinducer peptide [Enterococcus cecorum]|nr:cyclic lactone autoinducer peptide [Enterococcus cecorum]MDZ5601089.1 cyclic lactone autoinducer peptide [Enterococcus cecorum]